MACLVALVAVMMPSSAAAKEPVMKRVYMFGFSASLIDSTAYQTDVQQLDSAWIDPTHNFLVDRALYSLQLQSHVETKEHHKNTVCTVYFSTNPRKLQRKWAKVKKRYEHDPALRYQILPRERFAFQAEEYRPVIIGEPTVAPDSTKTQTQTPPPPPPGKPGSMPPGGKKPNMMKKP